MEKIYTDLTQLAGNTPLLELTGIEIGFGLKARLLAKLECFNPGGSVKDRAALAMIAAAEADGRLRPGSHIVEPTSGNTGIGLAWVAAVRGYHLTLTMPDTMSVERRRLLKALGAKLVLTPGSEGMAGAIAEAERIAADDPNATMMRQFDNPANPAAHEHTTAPEIWADTDGEVDILVAAVGTGGTLCGTARGLKSHNRQVEAVAVEPAGSPVLSGGQAGPHKIQGIGAGFIPGNYDPEVVDRVITVSDDEAAATARMLAETEGLLAGISSGAALHAAIKLAQDAENEGKTIVVILPDTGERYLSTPLFDSGE